MSLSRPTARPVERGFTLLELLLVMVLMSLFMGAVVESVIVGLRAVHAADAREEIRQQLAQSLERLTREIRLASNVDAAQSGRFQFDTPTLNNIDYVYTSATGILTHDDANTPQVTLVHNLTNFDFNYFDQQGTQLLEPVAGSAEDTIRVVQVIATVTKNSETITVATAAALRNM